MSSDRLGINISLDFENFNSADKKLKDLLDKLSKNNNLKINVDKNTFNSIENEFNKLKEKLEKGNLTPKISENVFEGVDKELDKFSQKLVQIGNAYIPISQTRQWSNELGQTIRLTEQINLKSGEVSKTIKDVTEDYKKQNKIQDDIFQTQKQYEIKLQNLKTQYGGIMDNDKIVQQVNELKKALDGLDNTNFNKKELSNMFNQLNADIKETSSSLKLTQKEFMSFGDSVKRAFGQIATYATMSFGIYEVVNFVRETSMEISNLDKQLTELAKVTDLPRSKMDDFALSSNDLAKSLSTTTSSILDSQIAFSRMGYDLETEVDKLASAASLMSVVGDLGIQDANDAITGLVKGYGISIDDLSNKIDSFNNVTNKNAVDFQDMVELMRRASATMKSTGNDLSETVGMFTAINTTIQNADVSATSLKSLALRLNGVTESGEKSGALMATVDKSLNKLGVSATDAEGKLRPTYEVMKELSTVLKNVDMNSLEVADALETLGGKHQYTSLVTLLENFDIAEKSMNEFNNASGSATKEFENYQKSVESYSNLLKNSLTELRMNLLDSDTIKFFLSVSTSVVDTINKFGALNTMVFAVSATFLVVNKSARLFTGSLITMLQGLNIQKLMAFRNEFSLMPIMFKKATVDGTGTTTMLKILGIELNLTKIAAIGLQTALTMGLSLALTAIVSGLTKWITKSQEAKQAQEELIQTAKEFYSKSFEAQPLIEEFEKLSEKANKTAEDMQRMVDINNILADSYPDLVQKTDAYHSSLEYGIDKLKNYTEEQKALYKAQLEAKKDKNNSELKTLQDKKKKIENEIKDLESKLLSGDVYESRYAGHGMSETIDMTQKYKDKLVELRTEIMNNSTATKTIEQELKDLNTIRQEEIQATFKGIEITKEDKKIKDGIIRTLQNQGYSIDEIVIALDNYIASLEQTKEKSEEAISPINILVTELENLYTNAQNSSNKVDVLTQAYAMLTNEGYISSEMLEKLEEIMPGITSQYDLNKDSIYKLISAEMDLSATSIAEAKKQAQATIDSCKAQIEAYSHLLDMMGMVSSAKGGISSGDEELDRKAREEANSIIEKSRTAMAEAQKKINQLNSLSGIINKNYERTIPNPKKDPKTSGGSATKKETKEVQDLSLELDKNIKLKEKLDDIENKLKANETSNKDKISILKEENELLNEKVNIQKELNNAYQNDKSGLKSSLSNNGVKFDLTGKISNGNEILKQRQDLANKMTGDTKEEAIKLVKKLQDDINSYNDLHLNLIPDIEIDMQSIKNNIKDNESELVKIFSDTLNEEINNVLSDSDSVMENINNKISLLGNIDESEKEEYLSYLQEMQKAYQNRYDIIGKSVDVLKDKLKTATKEEAEAIESQIKDLEKQSISVQIDMVANMDKFQSELDSILNEAKEKMKSEFEKISESIIYGSKGKDGYNSYIDKEINKLDQVIKAYNEAEKWQKREEERKDRLAKKEQLLLDIQKEKDKLENLKKQKTHQVLTKQADGSYQYEYTYDLDAIEDQQDKIKDLNEQLTQWQEDWNEYQKNLEKELLMESLENQKKKLEEERKSKEQAYTQMNDTFKNKVDECKTIQDLAMLDINSIVNTGMSEITKTYGIKFNEISQSSKDSVMNMLKHQLAYQQSLQTTIALLTQMKALSGGGSVNTPNTSTSKSSGKIAGAYSGGMTPSWGSNGKMMMLHQDELILNALDSKVLLNIQDIVKQLSTVNIPKGLNVGVNDIIDKIVKIPQQNTKDEKPIQQNVTIQANFPNVTAQDEIRKAFDGIELTAIQYLKE